MGQSQAHERRTPVKVEPEDSENCFGYLMIRIYLFIYSSGQIIATSDDLTLKGS